MPLDRKPRDVDSDNWVYDDNKGVLLVHRCRKKNGSYIQTDQVTIPWRTIRAALKRKDTK